MNNHRHLPCRDHSADLWFSEQPTEVELAKGLCHACPLERRCLMMALERRETCGVWGGHLFENGRIVPRKRPRGRPRKTDVRA